jgi:hypothetical protein
MNVVRIIGLLFFGALIAGTVCCTGNDDPQSADVPEPVAEAKFDIAGGFYDAPFPIQTRLREDGSVRFDDFPNPSSNAVMAQYTTVLDSITTGFSRNGIIYFVFDGAIDIDYWMKENAAEINDGFLFINIDPVSVNRGTIFPVSIDYKIGPGKYTPGNLLTMVPFPGYVAEPNTLYAALVLHSVILDDKGHRLLATPDAIIELFAGVAPTGGEVLLEGFAALAETLDGMQIATDEVAAATVFRTGDPDAGMIALREHAASLSLPDYSLTVSEPIRDYPSYCVLEGTMKMPIYQKGERPYNNIGEGQIVFENGVPQVQWTEDVRFSLSVPKKEMPAAGFPLLFFGNGSGGTYLQVVDRGTFAEQRDNTMQGRGPALYLADAGIAALDIEAPLTGPRHPTGLYDSIDLFNVFNLVAFRDNIRQAAVEFTILPRVAADLQIAIADYCSGVTAPGGVLSFDADNFFFWGHSTGSSIGTVALGVESAYRAGILSGAGGSWIYNLTLKQEPFAIAEVMAAALGIAATERVDEFHPISLIFQMSLEAVEAMNFARLWVDNPLPGHDAKNILLIEGLVDGYFLPRMANALAMAGRLDLAGPVEDDTMLDEIRWVGADGVALPAGPNRGSVSAHAVQFVADDFDGHYVAFELPQVKYTYKCWLTSILADGAGTVPVAVADGLASCP